ncbi:hypothetical protein [Sinisalibacter lacisalsi]|uniref:Imelysin-like domain-containing protein n=1 Tax=Sinisalibacter lacisalsi TaxID=1526570 RepID=A0ABQ1QRI3_9RHOB|nr:hypothetical protein [Sinisalibacter lacisalsi]GGD42406.1 hypothetical protein GCM10011358_27780 [Sinisalibacter lacisalsi]
MSLRILATGLALIASLTTAPARAQTFFEDSSLMSPIVTPDECASGYALMAQVLGQSDVFSRQHFDAAAPTADDYAERKNVLGQAIAETEGSLEAAEQAVAKTYQTMGHFLGIMLGTHAALELDGFARFITECDTAFDFEPKSDAYVHFTPRRDVPLAEQSPFNLTLYETEAGCTAAYDHLADLLRKAGELGVDDPGYVGAFSENLLTTTQPWKRADTLRARVDTAEYEAADEVFGLLYANVFLVGTNKWDLAALADGLTRCDRAFGFAPLTRRMLVSGNYELVRQMGNCLAGFDLAYEANPDGAITAGRTPLRFRERLFQRSGASYYQDLADIAEDAAKDFADALRSSPSMMVEEQFKAMVDPCM